MQPASSFLKDGETLRHRVTRETLDNLPAETEKLRILTLNTWTDAHLLKDRMEAIAATVQTETCDIVVLQECFSSGANAILDAALGESYHIVHADHRTSDLQVTWWGSLVPAGFVFGLSALADSYGWGHLATLLTVIAGLLIPWLFIRIVEATFLRQLHQRAFGSAASHWDWMALTVLVRKEVFLAVEVEACKPFAKAAYPYPRSIWAWPFFWFQMSFLRPGFLVVQCQGKSQDVTLAGCHCVIGDLTTANPGRKTQLEQVLYELRRSASPGALAVLAGDFNATADQPEVRMLHEAGWVDAATAVEPAAPLANLHTWDARNPYTRLTVPHEPDARIDYCFLKPPAATPDPLGSPNRVTVKSVRRIGTTEPFLSDHYGVLVETETELARPGGSAAPGEA